MIRTSGLFLLLLFLCGKLSAQITPDSSIIPPRIDSLPKDSTALKDSLLTKDTSLLNFHPETWDYHQTQDPLSLRWKILKEHPYFGFGARLQQKPPSTEHEYKQKDWLFYLLVFILLLFATFKNIFSKYFTDLFRLFFRTTLKQRQIKEQMLQTPLPSVLLNAFFVISGGLYITFLIQYFHIDTQTNFWVLYGWCCGALASIYLVKFIGLKITGWLFNMSEAADSYIFVVFLINKMIGIFLLPFLVLLAFTENDFYLVTMVLSWCFVGALLLYRFILTYSAVRNQVRVSIFHFFLYLCAFEIAPLLLIYKGLLLFFNISP